MNIVCLIFEGITTLDIVGPATVLARMPGTTVHWVGPHAGRVRSTQSRLGLTADYGLDDAPIGDVLLIPGGPGVRPLLRDSRILDWLRWRHERAEWTASVCTGSLLLAAAGLLQGRRATTHWNARPELAEFGVEVVPERVVVCGSIVTAAGVAAGIDMALTLAAKIAGAELAQAIQLRIEYDPAPPFVGGSPDKVGPQVLARVRQD